jgi:hypothetical protein
VIMVVFNLLGAIYDRSYTYVHGRYIPTVVVHHVHHTVSSIAGEHHFNNNV